MVPRRNSGGSDLESNHNNEQKTEKRKNDRAKRPECPFDPDYPRREYIFVVCAGLALAFNSGYINGACLSGLLVGRRQSVSGFTGAYTLSALSLADGDISFFGFQTCMFLSFMVGSTITGLMTPEAKPWRIAPTYGPTFLVGGCLLLASSLLAIYDTSSDRRLFFFAAAANGVQNGISSMYSGNLLRTCHMTGTSTDIGLLVGHYLRGNRKQIWKFNMLVGLAISFWCGGILSFFATSQFERASLLFNSGLFFAIGISLVIFLSRQLNISIRQAMFGDWTWKTVLYKLNLSTSDGKPVSSDTMMEVFDKADREHQGVVEEDDLYSALEEVELSPRSRMRLKSVIGVVDEHEEGIMSREEWKQIVSGESQVTQSSGARTVSFSPTTAGDS